VPGPVYKAGQFHRVDGRCPACAPDAIDPPSPPTPERPESYYGFDPEDDMPAPLRLAHALAANPRIADRLGLGEDAPGYEEGQRTDTGVLVMLDGDTMLPDLEDPTGATEGVLRQALRECPGTVHVRTRYSRSKGGWVVNVDEREYSSANACVTEIEAIACELLARAASLPAEAARIVEQARRSADLPQAEADALAVEETRAHRAEASPRRVPGRPAGQVLSDRPTRQAVRLLGDPDRKPPAMVDTLAALMRAGFEYSEAFDATGIVGNDYEAARRHMIAKRVGVCSCGAVEDGKKHPDAVGHMGSCSYLRGQIPGEQSTRRHLRRVEDELDVDHVDLDGDGDDGDADLDAEPDET
jgi:hypothetical protein